MATNHLLEITQQGQAVWLDNISRALIEDGELERLIREDGLTGVTSNPTIFDKAIGGSDRYDAALEEAARNGLDARETFFQLGFRDIRDGCDLLRDVFDRTEGQDGYVSFELPPELAHDAAGSVEQAKVIRSRIDRPNVLIKVPGTAEGVRGVRGTDRRRCERQRHAAVRRRPLRGDRRGVRARARAPRGGR